MSRSAIFFAFCCLLSTNINGQLIQSEPDTCECVPYFQCENGQIVTTGEGLLDIRIKTCSGIEVCCNLPDDPSNPRPRPVDPTPDPTPVDPFPVNPNPVDPPVNPPVEPTPVNPGGDERGVDGKYQIPTVTGGTGCGRRRLPGRKTLNDDALKISGGGGVPQAAFYGEAPWMARILKTVPESSSEEPYLCGGALITPSIVLTAAHCVQNGTNDIFIRLGEYSIKNEDEPIPPQDRKISRVIIHPEFNPRNLANDIALLGLDSPAILNEVVDIICTPDEQNPVNANDCFALGWGKNDWGRNSVYQDTLRGVQLPIITREDCQAKLRTTKLGKFFRLLPGFICAGGEPGSDTCKGDGGGPLICPLKSDSNRLAQVGIIAWGIECGKGNPAVFTSVQHYMPWIKSQLN